MIATANLPGSTHFRWFKGTKRQCYRFFNYLNRTNEYWRQEYMPQVMTDNATRKRDRYQDGTLIYDVPEGHYECDGLTEEAIINRTFEPYPRQISRVSYTQGLCPICDNDVLDQKKTEINDNTIAVYFRCCGCKAYLKEQYRIAYYDGTIVVDKHGNSKEELQAGGIR